MITNITNENELITATYDSSNIASSIYDTIDNTLYITFVKGNLRYKYDDVAPEDYHQMEIAQSTGEAFNQFIKRKYKGEKL